MADLELTKTERRMLDVLSDGMPHTESELRACVNDELSDNAVFMHVSRLRTKLSAVGRNIMFFRGEYMLMQRLQKAE